MEEDIPEVAEVKDRGTKRGRLTRKKQSVEQELRKDVPRHPEKGVTGGPKEEVNRGGVDEKLVKWDYGYGEEGVLGVAKEGQVVCFGSAFPWWGLVASRLNLQRVNLVITEVDSPYVKAARKYFERWPISEAPKSGSDLPELRSATVLLFDSVPEKWVCDVMWNLASVQVIVTTGKRVNTKIPEGWRESPRTACHQRVGGTSNGACRIMIYERKAGRAMLPTPVGGRPAQDLRSVMKMAKRGRKTEAPDLADPKETGASVIVAGPDVVSCLGL